MSALVFCGECMDQIHFDGDKILIIRYDKERLISATYMCNKCIGIEVQEGKVKAPIVEAKRSLFVGASRKVITDNMTDKIIGVMYNNGVRKYTLTQTSVILNMDRSTVHKYVKRARMRGLIPDDSKAIPKPASPASTITVPASITLPVDSWRINIKSSLLNTPLKDGGNGNVLQLQNGSEA